MKEFSEQGYEQASTNRIVREAGISKGILFYYFKSKKELFHYLIEYSLSFIDEQYLPRLDDGEPDFIEKSKQFAQVKMQSYTENPHIFNFLGALYVNPVVLTEGLTGRMLGMKQAANEKLYANVDTSLFRDDVSAEIIFKLIQWAMDGIEKEIVGSLQGKQIPSVDMNPYWDDFYDYLEVLKKLYYK